MAAPSRYPRSQRSGHESVPALYSSSRRHLFAHGGGSPGWFRSLPATPGLRASQVDYPTIQILTFYPGASPDETSGSGWRSEEHTSELQSRENLVCRLLLEKKK